MKKALFILTSYSLLLTPAFVSAQSVNILYHGMTYTPPFYYGGALWSNESVIRLFAVPQGLGDPARLFYKWSKNGTVLGNSNGVGKNSLIFSDTIFSKPVRVSVEILAADERVLSESSLTLVPSPTSLLVYEKNALLGFLWNREASSGYRLGDQEATFAAFPLFFRAGSRNDGNVAYVWRSNAATDSSESIVTYRVPDGAEGSTSISLKASNPATVRQGAEARFLLQFGNDNE